MSGAAARSKERLLIVTADFPVPVRDGFTRRVFDMAAFLGRHYRLDFVVLERGRVEEDRIRALQEKTGADHVEIVLDPMRRQSAGAWIRTAWFRVRRRIQRPRPFWRCYCPRALVCAVRRAARQRKPAIVMVNTPALTPAAFSLPQGTVRVCDTHDVWHEKYCNFSALGCGRVLEHFQDPADEARLLQGSHLIVAITDRDAAAFRRLLPGTPVVTAGVSFKPVALDRTEAEGLPTVLFVGGRGVENEDGVGFFIDQVWPRVRARVPDATFVVLGAAEGLRQRYAQSPGVCLREHVPDVREWYERAHVVVEPRRYGTGLKIKVIEALAHGSAMVISPAAAQGLPARGDAFFLLRETPEAFAEGVVQLLHGPAARRRLGERALRFVREELKPERVYAGLRGALAGLSPPHSRPFI